MKYLDSVMISTFHVGTQDLVRSSLDYSSHGQYAHIPLKKRRQEKVRTGGEARQNESDLM